MNENEYKGHYRWSGWTGSSSHLTNSVSPLRPFGKFYLVHQVPYNLNIRATSFHRFLITIWNSRLLFSPTFLFRSKEKELTKSGPDMKLPILHLFILGFHITSLEISTRTRKEILPSFVKNAGGPIFTTDSDDSCTLPVLGHKSTCLSPPDTEQ